MSNISDKACERIKENVREIMKDNKKWEELSSWEGFFKKILEGAEVTPSFIYGLVGTVEDVLIEKGYSN